MHQLGQSLWLDNITRESLRDGTLRRYIDDFAVTGLTSNPTIFEKAIGDTRFLRRRRSAKRPGKASPAKRCSSNWRWKT